MTSMHDLVTLADKFKADTLDIHLGPDTWNSFDTKVSLCWQSAPWKETKKNLVPETRGIYAFTVHFTNPLLPNHGYVLYIGITGAKKSRGTLRSRFENYFREKKKGRARVEYVLNKWRDHLTFQFAVVPDRRFSLQNLEKQLCDSLLPWANRNDLSARLRKGKEAAGL